MLAEKPPIAPDPGPEDRPVAFFHSIFTGWRWLPERRCRICGRIFARDHLMDRSMLCRLCRYGLPFDRGVEEEA